MATIDNRNWEYGKPVEGDSQATAPNGAKVQPVILDGSLAEGSTGNGNIGYDTSRIDTTDVNTKLQSIVFTEPDGSTTKPYEVENPEDLGSTNEVVVWIYDSNWATDDTVAFNFYSGGGDGTDYSYSADPNVTGDTGANPWGQSGINAFQVQHLSSSTTFTDSSPNGIDSTSVTGTNQVNGQFDEATNFDGSDDLISFGSQDTIENQDIFVAAWAKTSTSQGNVRIVTNQGTSGFDGFALDINEITSGSGTDEGARMLILGDNGDVEAVSSTALTDGNWHSIIGRYDKSAPEIQVFEDGNLEDTNTNDPGDSTSNGELAYGARFDGAKYYQGAVDAVRIYDDIAGKDETWVQAEYDASPKGGQIFFNAQTGSTTDQVGSVKQTNSSGVIQTTADGVIKTEP